MGAANGYAAWPSRWKDGLLASKQIEEEVEGYVAAVLKEGGLKVAAGEGGVAAAGAAAAAGGAGAASDAAAVAGKAEL